MRTLILVWMWVALLPIASAAGEYNSQLSPGDPAPDWKDLPGIDDKMHALADLKDREVLVVVFTCCSCPAAVDYEDRILAFAKRYVRARGKVGLVAINANTIPEDRLDKMKERAKEKGFTFPYLFDETQRVARKFGAEYTPEFFVLDKERKVVYMGALDDRDDPKLATRDFLEEGVQAALAGKKPKTAETLGRGCKIRYVKKKPK
jgi:peroxiredoxin